MTTATFAPGKVVSCDIPLAIVPKARPRVFVRNASDTLALSGSGKPFMDAIKPARYSRCLKQIGLVLRSRYGNDRRWPTDASYRVRFEVTVHSSNDGDCDNFVGTVMDAGNGIVWLDDRQIVEATVCKRLVPRTEPRTARLDVEILSATGFEPKRKR